MASGVAAVWLPVKDMKRALGFYGDMLGLEVTSESDEWSELDANGLMVGLNARESSGADGSGGALLTFQPDGGIDDEVGDLDNPEDDDDQALPGRVGGGLAGG